jgi:hypothetical protein
MQMHNHRPRIEMNHWVINVGSLLAGDFFSAILLRRAYGGQVASKLASHNCINPAKVP